MKRLLVAALLIALVSTVSMAQSTFPSKTFKKFTDKELGFDIYLIKNFKALKTSVEDAKAYKRKKDPKTEILVRKLELIGLLSGKQLFDYVDDLFWKTYQDEEENYHFDFMTSPVATVFGANGYQFQLTEFTGKDDDKLTFIWQFFVDGEGYLYVILGTSAIDKSPDSGQAMGFNMHNGIAPKLKKPLTAQFNRDYSIERVWKKLREMKQSISR